VIQQVEAIYEHGILRPLQPLDLQEAERVLLSVSPAASYNSVDDTIDHSLIEYAKARVASMPRILSLEEVRASLSRIDGSMAETIIAERGEH
jgi:predicted DNA-binding antitoxin AbrB/MazE fold protein